ncbi:MAG: RHS repeat-associated core domain-containing protein, partial [Azoarcus sp.]|nr:RHS repeat-associated core domain-containing protein [Azoarcus sp.]
LDYDAEGRLRKTTLGGTATELLYDGVDLIAEYDGAGALLRKYVHGPGIDEPLAVIEGSTKTWLYADHQGSVVGQANASGTNTAIYSYGPFGEPNTTTGVRFRYTGQQYIGALNLYYYKARFYSPTLGRFLQTDPAGTVDDLNLYAYVGNDPVNFSDPSGEFFVNVIAGAGGAVIGAIGGGMTAYIKSGGDWSKTAQGAGAGALIGGVTGLTFGAGTGMTTAALVARGAIKGAVGAAGANAAGQYFGNSGEINLTETAVVGALGAIPGGTLGALKSTVGAQSTGNILGSIGLANNLNIATTTAGIGISARLPEVTINLK